MVGGRFGSVGLGLTVFWWVWFAWFGVYGKRFLVWVCFEVVGRLFVVFVSLCLVVCVFRCGFCELWLVSVVVCCFLGCVVFSVWF